MKSGDAAPYITWAENAVAALRADRNAVNSEAAEIAQNLISNGGITKDQANHALDITNANVLTLARAYLKQ